MVGYVIESIQNRFTINDELHLMNIFRLILMQHRNENILYNSLNNLKWDIQIASDRFGTLRINFDKDLVTKERERLREAWRKSWNTTS